MPPGGGRAAGGGGRGAAGAPGGAPGGRGAAGSADKPRVGFRGTAGELGGKGALRAQGRLLGRGMCSSNLLVSERRQGDGLGAH